MSEWKPIKDAPHNEPILLAHVDETGKLFWIASGMVDGTNDAWIDVMDDNVKRLCYHAVTHWQELPTLPVESKP